MNLLLLIPKNIRRNLVRSILTASGTMFLVLVVTLIWSFLVFLDRETKDRARNIKAIVTERWQIPSQMPYSYASRLSEGAPREKSDYRVQPDDSMTWQFYGGTTDQGPRTRENTLFAFALEPRSLLTMMNELDELPQKDPKAAAELGAAIDRMEKTRPGMIVGLERLKSMQKKIGERIKLYSINFKGIDLEFEIVGVFPKGRYDTSAAMNRDYLNSALDDYERKNKKKHPIANKSLGLVWLRLPDTATFNQVATQITESPEFTAPAVKCETASSGIGAFLEGYRHILWGLRYLLAPTIFVILALVIANAISISVRERRLEFAVLKVLGFQPSNVLALVVGEALLLGMTAGFLSSAGTWLVVNHLFGGINFRIAFFPGFLISNHALWWGPAIGGLAAFLGSIIPAWNARNTKVADVFARVA